MLCLGAKMQTTVQGGSWQTRFTTTTIIIIIIILIFCNIFIFVNSGRDSGPPPAAFGHTPSPPSSTPSRRLWGRPRCSRRCPFKLLCS